MALEKNIRLRITFRRKEAKKLVAFNMLVVFSAILVGNFVASVKELSLEGNFI